MHLLVTLSLAVPINTCFLSLEDIPSKIGKAQSVC